MDPLIYSEFIVTCLAFVVSPGPSVMIAVTHAVSHGLRISYMTALGDITANLLQMLIALAGVFYLSKIGRAHV